jgi:membrane-associated phospholipid phosphatase
VNRLGSGGLLAVAALAIAVVLAVRRRDVSPLVRVGAAFVLTGVVLVALKWLFHRPAPHSALADGASYPSGHAVNTIVWYGVIAALLATGSRALRWAPPVLVTVAGTYLGHHWLTDMLAGLCLGVLLDQLLAIRVRRAEPQPQPR